MPRGRRSTLMVFVTFSVAASTTVIVLSFSFETKIVSAEDGVASRAKSKAPQADIRMRIIGFTFNGMTYWRELLEFAFGFRLIEAKSVGEVGRMQETFLWRGGDGHARAAAENNRLPH